MVKNNKGSRKIEMKKIQNESNLQVTFSKRRFGILMLVFSPGGKVFSFGHPNVRDLIECFSIQYHNSIISHQQNNSLQLIGIHPDGRIQYLNNILTQMLLEQEKEKDNSVFLNHARECREQRGNWYEKDVKELDMNQTNNLIFALEGMKNKLIDEISPNSPVNNVPQIHYMGESSCPNVGVGIDHFDQRSNIFMNNNPNMVLLNYAPSFGYNNHGDNDPTFNFN